MDGYIGGMIPKKKKKQPGVFNPLESQPQGINMRATSTPEVPTRNMYPDFNSDDTFPDLADYEPPPAAPPPAEVAPIEPGTNLDNEVYDPSWNEFPMPPNMMPEQMEFLQNYVTYMSGMLERLGSDEAFLPEFEYPEFTDFYPEDYYERVVRDPAMSRFTETTMPNLRESMGSGFWSTARQKGEQKAMTDLDQMLLAEQAKMESDRTKSRTQWEQDRAKMQLQHTGMEEKARQNYMNQMLGMLGISPFDTVVPGEDGGGLLDELAPGSQPWWLDPGGNLLNWLD